MYLAESRSARPAATTSSGRTVVPGTVLALGAVSLITDISSEMVTAVLPLYVVAGLGLSPLGFGLLDGINNGVGALVRLLGGHLADRGGRGPKTVAAVGYGLSALCKPLLLLAHTLPLISAVLAVDRTGKGLRTAPRDAMISLATAPEHRGRAFGVHRAMDTTGALLGPLLAFAILRITIDGYDAVFAVSACVAALGVLVLFLFVPARVTAIDEQSARPTLRESLALLRVPALRRLTVCAVLLGLTTVSDSFLYLLLQRELALPASLFPLLPIGTSAVFLLLAVPMGTLADRLGRRRLFLAGHGALHVECPSVSPDGTRIAYKKRIPDASSDVPWRLYVLDLATMTEHPTAEQRNIDDQALWADGSTLVYSLPGDYGTDLWTVPADGSGAPRKLMSAALAPAYLG